MRNLFKYTFGTATAGDGGGCAKEKYLNLPRNSLLPFPSPTVGDSRDMQIFNIAKDLLFSPV